jgi:hypothetical protein
MQFGFLLVPSGDSFVAKARKSVVYVTHLWLFVYDSVQQSALDVPSCARHRTAALARLRNAETSAPFTGYEPVITEL